MNIKAKQLEALARLGRMAGPNFEDVEVTRGRDAGSFRAVLFARQRPGAPPTMRAYAIGPRGGVKKARLVP